eukprot:2990807-Alexandrium_andersonii.AAC.1
MVLRHARRGKYNTNEVAQPVVRWSVAKNKRPLAFNGLSDSDRCFRVAQVEDEWVSSGAGSFRSWSICTANHGGTTIL